MLEPYTAHVYVESPPTNDLPRQLDNRIAIEMSDDQRQRVIYLRPGDTVCLDAEYHDIKILATKFSGSIGAHQDDQSAIANDVLVESSVQNLAAETRSGGPESDDDTDDEDDLDVGAGKVTPAPSPPPDISIKETPSGPSRDRNYALPAAPDVGDAQQADGSVNDPDTSTPAARAGAQRDKQESMQPHDDAESQIVVPPTNRKPVKKYGGTVKQKREIAESSDTRGMTPPRESSRDESAASESHRGGTRSSPPKRKRLTTDADDEDEGDGAIPASTAPPLKRGRGRPTKASKAVDAAARKALAPTKPERLRSRPSNASKVAQEVEDAEHRSSPGKLKMPSRRSGAHRVHDNDTSDHEHVATAKSRGKLSPDLNPRSSATPQSPGTPMTWIPPTKILLSHSKFTNDGEVQSFFRKYGAAISSTIPGKRTNFICVVGNGELANTAKVLRSLALGKRVVTDEWIEESIWNDHLLDPDTYIHEDLAETADIDRGELFTGKTLFITDALAKAYGTEIDNIKGLATAAGAWKVESGSVKKGIGMPAAGTIFLGGDGNDHDAMKLREEGRTVYQKALLTHSVIKGELLVDEKELEWQETPKTPKTGKKGK
jgi:hypothetical protein